MPRHLLFSGWELCSTAPGLITHPNELAGASIAWQRTSVPSTAASALRMAGAWSFDAPSRRFDAEDWWYRTRFDLPAAVDGDKPLLGFDGLATLADVWLNGRHLLTSENMFLAHQCELSEAQPSGNELVIRFRSLDAALAVKRPRPRWRSPMVENQQLRWFRTTLLGRTPGWSPPAAAVGPWREIWLDRRRTIRLQETRLHAYVQDALGIVEITGDIQGTSAEEGLSVNLVLEANGHRVTAEFAVDDAGRFQGRMLVQNPQLWWPHTHGEPALYRATAGLRSRGGEPAEVDLGCIAFRTISWETGGGDFALSVNGIPVFCRGACWTPVDVVSLQGSDAEYDGVLEQVKSCGMNMLRVCGAMVYEKEYFYARCDALGILVWQDFMFANMDYPQQDAAFLAGVEREVAQVARMLGRHPCVAIACGNSEVEQQAAMWGAPRNLWAPALFHEVVSGLLRCECPRLAYWPSSAHGGAFPHEIAAGSSSYYGVGAYLRPVEDARRSELKFASECLAFANVPEPATIESMPGGHATRVHHPGWKARSPRDLGAGWDFDDVRDHYLAEIFKADALKLRYGDHDRYLAMSRIVPAEMMLACFAEWRRSRSTCQGALIWFLRDLWPGAGWGIIASDGEPKAPYFYLRRALQPLAVSISDEGCNGLAIHLVNETSDGFSGALELVLYRQGEHETARAQIPVTLAPRESAQLSAAQLFDGFYDFSYAYRFGPPSHDLVIARLDAAGSAGSAEAYYFPTGLSAHAGRDLGLVAHAQAGPDGSYRLTLRTRAFAQSVIVEAEHYRCSDQHFHLAPGAQRSLDLRPRDPQRPRPLRGLVRALNAIHYTPIELQT